MSRWYLSLLALATTSSTRWALATAAFAAGEDGYTTVTVNTSGGYGLTERLFRAFAAADLPLAELRVNKADLEDVFLKLAESEETENPEKEEEEA